LGRSVLAHGEAVGDQSGLLVEPRLAQPPADRQVSRRPTSSWQCTCRNLDVPEVADTGRARRAPRGREGPFRPQPSANSPSARRGGQHPAQLYGLQRRVQGGLRQPHADAPLSSSTAWSCPWESSRPVVSLHGHRVAVRAGQRGGRLEHRRSEPCRKQPPTVRDHTSRPRRAPPGRRAAGTAHGSSAARRSPPRRLDDLACTGPAPNAGPHGTAIFWVR
jgi:hypothetical protein